MFDLILDSVEDFHTVEERRLHRIFCGLQQFNSVNRIVVISSGEKELHRVSQTVYDSVELCVPPAFGTANRLIRRFFPRHLRFHAPLRKWSPCSGSPYPRPQTVCGIPLPECPHSAIWRILRI